MGKRGKVINPKSFSRNRGVASDDMDDEIDAFHKQRDIIPLDANGDIVDSDDEIPVFDLKGINDDEDEDDETGDIAKMARTQKYLREKFGGAEDAMLEDDEEDEEEQESLWGGKKKEYYHGDNADYEAQSSDDDGPLKEEEAVKKLQMQKAESYTIEDFGLDVIEDFSDPSDRELTLEEMSAKREGRKKYPGIKEAFDDTGAAYEEVEKDLSALSKEEQMDVLYR
nr:ribosome biogenesis protein BOP1 homolog [Quercus suber]